MKNSSSPKFTVSKETTVLTEPLRADGGVQFLSNDISLTTLLRLGSRNDGDDVGDY